jgi:lysophospholipase L1-like esterase
MMRLLLPYLLIAFWGPGLLSCTEEEVLYHPPIGNEPKPPVKPHVYPDTLLSVLVLGDSYTVGYGVEYEKSWPLQLAGRLQEEGFSMDIVTSLAFPGWSTSDLLSSMKSFSFDPPYELVGVLIGVNNQYRRMSLSLYEYEFRQIVTEAIKLAGHIPARVFVLSVPDYSVTPSPLNVDPGTTNYEINLYNQINQSISAQYGVTWFNVTDISRQAGSDYTLLADDMLHPSAIMYTQWVDTIFPGIMSMLQDSIP